MLYEIRGVRQNPEEDRRRWFTDNDFWDLYIWEDDNNEITGMQLCYERNHDEKALSWFKNGTFTHAKIDSGESAPKNSTPILITDGNLDKKMVAGRFKKDSRNLDRRIVVFVMKKILEFAR